MLEWNKWFDKIYCVHYIQHKERLPRISAELKRVGILDSGVFDWFYDYDSPFFRIVQQNLNVCGRDKDILEPSRFSYFKCSFTHYRLWKQICCHGFKRVLVIEDDEVFLKDLNKLEQIYSQSLDFDLCLFDKAPFSGSCVYQQESTAESKDYPVNFKDFSIQLNLCSSGNYSLTLPCAEIFAKMYEKKICASDGMWRDPEVLKAMEDRGLKKAFSVVNASYQLPYDGCLTGQSSWDLVYQWAGVNKSDYQQY